MERILLQRPDVAWKEVDGQVILMDHGERKSVHRLNSVGSFLWTKFNGDSDLNAILKDLCSEFEVPEAQAKSDLVELVAKLEELGVLVGS